MSTTKKDWDKPIMAGFPQALFMQPVGANRAQRRRSRQSQSDPMPPSSMTPAVKRIKTKKVAVSGTIERNLNAVDQHRVEYVEVPTGEVEYVAQR